MIAVLFCDPKGVYASVPRLDLWGEERDAHRYAGPHAVIAHPPCGRWCRLAGLVEARYPHLKKGEDGGCFAAALAAVRRFGGVLEHPAYSDAWAAHDLTPPAWCGWSAGIEGGYSAHVEQGRYGHRAKKATWLYVYGVPLDRLPTLNWGRDVESGTGALVSWCANHSKKSEPGLRDRIGRKAASATPAAFRDLLVSIAASVDPRLLT